ncbi:MAG: hypothetical protein E7813_21455 [Bradyrhizobium sp.]|uniref:hypothetical protein n=1 Tax=Bradyrhizobium sp. TaxID=376 RepID=UPI001200E8C5|nr:hypothetical protein [Bradyrhizobium sp.]THD61807.1 MAG: hypothetical protein E7813_21455 [Bradyrhizobium sp.]
MSTNFNIKPVGAPAAQSANSAVATELLASASVTATADPIAYRVADNRTSLVVQQFPDESILRRRAYFRALDLTRRAPTRLVVTDRMA